MKFLLLEECPGKWIWELRNQYSETVCRSAQRFNSRGEAMEAVELVRRIAPGALVFDPLGTLYEKAV